MNKFYTAKNELDAWNFSEELYWKVMNGEICVDDALEIVGL